MPRFTYDRLKMLSGIITVIAAVAIFYEQVHGLPSDVKSLKVQFVGHCAAQDEKDKDRDERLRRIEDKLDRLIEDRYARTR
jgi:hypothetical protein